MINEEDLPLSGTLVVSIEQAVAGPYCGRLLADQGARVIKVERPDGGDFGRRYDRRVNGEASYFVWLNRSKESLCLDLKDPGDLALLWRLIEKADVFIQNLAPGAVDKLGLTKEALAERNPKLISCAISGFGPGGPCGGRKAYDLLIQAESGLLSITGTKETPSKVGISIVDICTGVTAYHLILAALMKRQRSGRGDHIELSMLEAMTEWMGYPLHYTHAGAPPPERAGAGHATIYPYGPFPTADGTVLFGLQNDREWAAFCEHVLRRSDWADEPRYRGNDGRATHKNEIDPVIRESLAELSSAEALDRLDRAGIGTAEVRDMAGLWAHPQLAARHRWASVATAAGVVPAFLPPSGDGWRARMDPVPALGEHSDAIRAEFDAEHGT
ncbi:CaiB/BaiF CoA transferase family protein [Polymorphum gilvum]|uniref:Formyl-CoA transferase-like protein n=1 Tax=Polymorphum gilvum (strain LMG 25793 / CGMCC 1.9160 / SL003B-26A1) TaxID=991905 RepID=F2J3X9_POLGS|nr:CaiB/BaiF CoA-transferase family protein [Polymorphum gilvum]ADZ68961.1 formyl-CoA transferase-like protein [Polymorphum gilvum SL003B-26A1]